MFYSSKQFSSAGRGSPGVTLVEVIIALLIFTVTAVALGRSLIWLQYSAEDNLYTSTAFTVASSVLEQMKSASTDTLKKSIIETEFTMRRGSGTDKLLLGQDNTLTIPLSSDAQNNKTMPLVLRPTIQAIDGNTGFLLRIEYSYDHPSSGRTRTKIMACMRSNVNSY